MSTHPSVIFDAVLARLGYIKQENGSYINPADSKASFDLRNLRKCLRYSKVH